MRSVKASTMIFKSEGGKSYRRYVRIGPCPHCLGYELVVGCFHGTSHAVNCGGCGALGPIASTDQRAVELWNETMHVRTEFLGDWEESAPDLPSIDDDELQF